MSHPATFRIDDELDDDADIAICSHGHYQKPTVLPSLDSRVGQGRHKLKMCLTLLRLIGSYQITGVGPKALMVSLGWSRDKLRYVISVVRGLMYGRRNNNCYVYYLSPDGISWLQKQENCERENNNG